jgi:hypothetical protein
MKPVRRNPNEPIEAILEECRLRLAQGDTIAACLADYPARAAELATLLPLVVQTQTLAHAPDPRYAAAAKRRFQSALATAKQNRDRAARPVGVVGWLARLAVPLALVLILSASGLGLVQAADNSLPDSPLYSVKQATENVSGALATSPPSRAALQIRLANNRKTELERAIAAKKGPGVILVLAQTMVNASNQATEQALLTQGQTRDEIASRLRPLLTAEEHDLATLASDSRPVVATRVQALEQQLSADEKSLGSNTTGQSA